jgi:hypothetical protein
MIQYDVMPKILSTTTTRTNCHDATVHKQPLSPKSKAMLPLILCEIKATRKLRGFHFLKYGGVCARPLLCGSLLLLCKGFFFEILLGTKASQQNVTAPSNFSQQILTTTTPPTSPCHTLRRNIYRVMTSTVKNIYVSIKH